MNSVYTSCGKIDGDIYYPDILEYMAAHPIVQLFTSRQFQGTVTSKLLSEDEIAVVAKIDR